MVHIKRSNAKAEKTEKSRLHGALKQGFVAKNSYTSDEHDIRHAMTEERIEGFEDAKYMLVSCCAFVNYLLAKTAKAGIKL